AKPGPVAGLCIVCKATCPARVYRFLNVYHAPVGPRSTQSPKGATTMKTRLLGMALLAGLAAMATANAQEFDDRWYVTGSAGMNIQDGDRGTRDTPFGTLGMGKFISPEWSLDGELNYQNANLDENRDLNWSQYGISLDLRRHFINEGRGWNPYLLVGLGARGRQGAHAPVPGRDSPGGGGHGQLGAKVGVRALADAGGVKIRSALGDGADFDHQSVDAAGEDGFGDVLGS